MKSDAAGSAVGVVLIGSSVGAVLAHGAGGHGPLQLLPPLVLLLIGVLVSPASLIAELLGPRYSVAVCLLVATAGQLTGTTWPAAEAVCAFVVGIAVALVQPLALLAVRQWCGRRCILAGGLGVAGFAAGALSSWPIGVFCGLAALWWIGLSLSGARWRRSGERVPPLPFRRPEVWLMAIVFGSTAQFLVSSSGWVAASVCVLLPRVLSLPIGLAQTNREVVPFASLMFGLGHLANGLSRQLLPTPAVRFSGAGADLALLAAAAALLLASWGLLNRWP
ncbi:hypothetical protein ACIBG5_41395 [Kribbella sp. NPDC050241]|uniref:hypothetical protein n=1 Tax=Kribbella sp. NPDC050241 TaxID=3364115 RepID=UPI003797BB3A